MKQKEMLALMGQIVTVTKEYKRKHIYPKTASSRYGGHERKWEVFSMSIPRAGWVIGIRSLMNGDYVAGGGFDEDYDPPYLQVRDTVRCLLVSYWPTMKPVRVPLDGWKLGGAPMPPVYSWTERDRGILRNEMKNVKRDERGRWLK